MGNTMEPSCNACAASCDTDTGLGDTNSSDNSNGSSAGSSVDSGNFILDYMEEKRREKRRKAIQEGFNPENVSIDAWRVYIVMRDKYPASDSVSKLRNKIFFCYISAFERVVAAYYRRKIPAGSMFTLEDALQEARLICIELIDEYDPGVGCTFMQFANGSERSTIIGRLIDAMRRLNEMPRRIPLYRRVVNDAVSKMSHALGRRVTIDEVIDRHKGTVIENAVKDSLTFAGVYSESQSGDGDDAGDFNGSELRDNPIASATKRLRESIQECRELDGKPGDDIRAIIRSIPDLEARYVLEMYYIEGSIMADIASTLSMCLSSVTAAIRRGHRYITAMYSKDAFIRVMNGEKVSDVLKVHNK